MVEPEPRDQPSEGAPGPDPVAPGGAAPEAPGQPAPGDAGTPAAEVKGESSWAVAWRMFRKNRLAMSALLVVYLLFGVAVFAPLLANGRPLYVRGHLTHVYENDVAAFLDWHERFRAVTLRLRAGVGARERERLEELRGLYRRGLPGILTRISRALHADQRGELAGLAEDYEALLAASPAGLDLGEFDRLGGHIEREYCGLSLVAAYKRAAAPLLRVGEMTDEVAEARDLAADALGGAERAEAARRLDALAAEGREVADAAEAGVESMLRFVPPGERGDLVEPAARLLADLRGLTAPERDMAAVRADLAAVEEVLDALAERPTPPAQQLLPSKTRWPVFQYLTAAEVGFIALYLTVTGCVAGRRGLLRLGPRTRAAVVLGPGLAAGLLWAAVVPERLPPAESLYKAFARQLAADPDAAGVVVFPPVPFGENENIFSDREAPPIVFERQVLAAWEARPEDERAAAPTPSLVRRLREPGEDPIDADEARARLTRLRTHWLGADGNGRDVLARLIIGSRVSLSVGFVAVSIYLVIGVVLGAVSGYFGSWVDMLISRVTEVVQCFPRFFLIIAAMSLVAKPSIFYIMVILGLTGWTEVMRLTRGEFLRLVSSDFVTAGQALGLSPARIVFRHLLPNAMGPVFVAGAFGVAAAILIESALSFLGFGVPAPQASWGSVLHDSRGHEKVMWWLTIFPGLLIFTTITAYNLIGEGLRDALDPKLRR